MWEVLIECLGAPGSQPRFLSPPMFMPNLRMPASERLPCSRLRFRLRRNDKGQLPQAGPLRQCHCLFSPCPSHVLSPEPGKSQCAPNRRSFRDRSRPPQGCGPRRDQKNWTRFERARRFQPRPLPHVTRLLRLQERSKEEKT